MNSLFDVQQAKRIAQQAWPTLVGQWAVMAYGVLDTAMTGHQSKQALAAMALGASVYASVFVGLMGVVTALNPICAQHFGAKRMQAIGQAWGQGVWVALALSVLGSIAFAFPDVWLSMSGEVEPAVRAGMRGYLHALIFALPFALLFRTLYAMNTAVSRPRVIMSVQIFGLCIKVVMNYALIYGNFGFTAMGATGAGIATAVAVICQCLAAFTFVFWDDFYKQFGLRLYAPDWSQIREILKLGIPMGLSYVIEVTSFTFMALLIAKLGTVTLGAHQIVANLAAVCFMIPMALGLATSTLTAQAIGAQDLTRAKLIGNTGIMMAALLGTITAGVLWWGRYVIVGAYTSDPQVAQTALMLIGFVAGFHLFDALQGATGFVLRAYKIAVAPTVVYAIALWGVGLIGGYWLCFSPVFSAQPYGAPGMWLAQALALALAAIALLALYHHKTTHIKTIEPQAPQS